MPSLQTFRSVNEAFRAEISDQVVTQVDSTKTFWGDLAGDFRDIRATSAEELSESSNLKRVALIPAVGSLACEWLTGSDIALVTYFAGNVLEKTHSIPWAMAAAGVGTTVVQAAFGFCTIPSIHNLPKTMSTVRQKVEIWSGKASDTTEFEATTKPGVQSFLKQWGTTFLTGTALTALTRNAKEEQTPKKDFINAALVDSPLVGLGSALVALPLGAIAKVSPEVGHALSTPYPAAAALLALTYGKLRTSHAKRLAESPKS